MTVFKYINENGDSVTFTQANGYIIQKPSGIDTLQVDLSEAQGINQTGSTIQSVNIKSRPIVINGNVCGTNQSGAKERLINVVRPDLKGKLYADDYYLEVYPKSTPAISAVNYCADFQFSLVAPYPYWMKDDSVDKVLAGVENKFRLGHLENGEIVKEWLINSEYEFGGAMSTQFINVYNGGQVPIPFTAVFRATGAVTNPSITNVSINNQLLKINKSMEAGEMITVEITHSRMYATSTIDGDIRGALALSNTFNRLKVGDNVLKPDADSGVNNLTVSVKFATEITGIVL